MVTEKAKVILTGARAIRPYLESHCEYIDEEGTTIRVPNQLVFQLVDCLAKESQARGEKFIPWALSLSEQEPKPKSYGTIHRA